MHKTPLKGASIAFIGAGAMGEAMISSLLNSHTVEPKAVTASDPAPQRAKDLEARFGIHATTDNHAAAHNAQIVILSVKPQMLRFVFRDLIARPRRPQSRLETGFLAYSGAALVYVVAVAALALTGVPKFVSGILEGRVDEPVRGLVGLAAALALTALTIGPFIGEVLAARTEKAAG